MALDGNFIHALVHELKVLERGKINKIQQLDAYTVVFKVRANRENHQFIISAHPMYSRLHITQYKHDFPFDPPSFLRILRKHLDGGIIQSINQIRNDRRVEISINSRNEIGDDIERKLILELMGRHSNIILVDENDKIIDGIKHLTPNNNSRTVMPGFLYEAPPTKEKLNPYTDELLELPELIDINSGKLNKQILNHIEGFSPLFIHELEYRSNFLSQKNIVSEIRNLMEQTKEVSPVLYQFNNKNIFYFMELLHLEHTPIRFTNLSELLDDYFHHRYETMMIKQKSSDYIQLIEREYDKVDRKIIKLNDDIKEAEDKERYQKYGELITAYMHQIKPYQEEAEVFDYYTNENIVIPLDVNKTPNENAQKYYQKYNKLKKRDSEARIQVKKATEDKAYLNNVLHQIENVSNEQDMEEIREELMEEGFLKQKNTNTKKKKSHKIELMSFELSSGKSVLVGRNNKQNDYLTNKKADKTYTWFHTKDIPGSHVVIMDEIDSLSDNDILEAATIAAYYSKAKESQSVPVDFTIIKNVHKVSGAKPGFVTYTDQKTVYVDPDPNEISRLKREKAE